MNNLEVFVDFIVFSGIIALTIKAIIDRIKEKKNEDFDKYNKY